MGVVPNSETLRLQALEASWAKGRWIARRRIAWRWTLWYAQQPRVWMVLSTVAVGLTLWFQATQNDTWLRTWQQSSAVPPAVARPDAGPAAVPTPPSMPPSIPLPTPVPTITSADTEALPLRWSAWGSATTPLAAGQVAAAAVSDDQAAIVLQLDTQLHTPIKEPQ
jgi:hypothetical protein